MRTSRNALPIQQQQSSTCAFFHALKLRLLTLSCTCLPSHRLLPVLFVLPFFPFAWTVLRRNYLAKTGDQYIYEKNNEPADKNQVPSHRHREQVHPVELPQLPHHRPAGGSLHRPVFFLEGRPGDLPRCHILKPQPRACSFLNLDYYALAYARRCFFYFSGGMGWGLEVAGDGGGGGGLLLAAGILFLVTGFYRVYPKRKAIRLRARTGSRGGERRSAGFQLKLDEQRGGRLFLEGQRQG